jgi:hypothetical protein
VEKTQLQNRCIYGKQYQSYKVTSHFLRRGVLSTPNVKGVWQYAPTKTEILITIGNTPLNPLLIEGTCAHHLLCSLFIGQYRSHRGFKFVQYFVDVIIFSYLHGRGFGKGHNIVPDAFIQHHGFIQQK